MFGSRKCDLRQCLAHVSVVCVNGQPNNRTSVRTYMSQTSALTCASKDNRTKCDMSYKCAGFTGYCSAELRMRHDTHD